MLSVFPNSSSKCITENIKFFIAKEKIHNFEIYREKNAIIFQHI